MKRLFLFIGVAISCLQGWANWNTDLSENTQITPTGLSYYDKALKTNKNGYTYAAFVCPAENSMATRLQIIDKDGNRTLGRGGKIVASEKNRPWLTWNQYLQLDNEGNAFLSVQDLRTSDDNLTYTIYKFSESGEQLWNGTLLNNGNGYAMSAGLSMLNTNDDGLLCTFFYTDPEINKDVVLVEKLDKTGKSEWKKSVCQMTINSLPYPFLADAGEDRAMIMWVDNGNIEANVINTKTGEMEKDKPVTVYSGGFASPKVMEVLNIAPTHDNGVLISTLNANVQGSMVYVKNDLSIGLDGNTNGILFDKTEDYEYGTTKPEVVYNDGDNTFSCVYKRFYKKNTRIETVYYQKVSMDGKLKWDGGKEIVAQQDEYQQAFFNLRSLGNDKCALFYLKHDNMANTVFGLVKTFDKDGNASEEETEFTTSDDNKVELWVSEQMPDKRFFTAWDQKIDSKYYLFMQDIKIDTPTGISLQTTSNSPEHNRYFSINGTQRNGMGRGINIVKYGNGNTVKIAR